MHPSVTEEGVRVSSGCGKMNRLGRHRVWSLKKQKRGGSERWNEWWDPIAADRIVKGDMLSKASGLKDEVQRNSISVLSSRREDVS